MDKKSMNTEKEDKKMCDRCKEKPSDFEVDVKNAETGEAVSKTLHLCYDCLLVVTGLNCGRNPEA